MITRIQVLYVNSVSGKYDTRYAPKGWQLVKVDSCEMTFLSRDKRTLFSVVPVFTPEGFEVSKSEGDVRLINEAVERLYDTVRGKDAEGSLLFEPSSD